MEQFAYEMGTWTERQGNFRIVFADDAIEFPEPGQDGVELWYGHRPGCRSRIQAARPEPPEEGTMWWERLSWTHLKISVTARGRVECEAMEDALALHETELFVVGRILTWVRMGWRNHYFEMCDDPRPYKE